MVPFLPGIVAAFVRDFEFPVGDDPLPEVLISLVQFFANLFWPTDLVRVGADFSLYILILEVVELTE